MNGEAQEKTNLSICHSGYASKLNKSILNKQKYFASENLYVTEFF